MKGLIVYTSKYGATRQYAEWLRDELNIPIRLPEDVTRENIQEARYILLGTPVYYGKFSLRKWIRKNETWLFGKKIFLFITTATSADEQEKRKQFVTANISPDLLPFCNTYFMPGRVVHKQLSFVDSLMLKLASGAMKDDAKKNAMRTDIDGVKKENIDQLLTDVRSYEKNT